MREHNILTDTDRCRLGRLLASDETRGFAPWKVLHKLECLLEDARAMQPESIPYDVVTMNSTVLLVHANSDVEIICTVVYPEDVDLVDEGISVLEALGTRLLGCEVGDLIECEVQKDSGPWRVAEIVFQPERVGKFEL